MDKWQTIEDFGDKHKVFSLDFCSAVMMRVDEGQDDEDEEDEEDGDEEKEGDDECDGDKPQRSRRFR